MAPIQERWLRNEPESTRQKLVQFIIAQARLGTDSIGFIPYEGLERRVLENNVVVLENNDDPIGFAVVGGQGSSLRCFQIWVRPDARLLLHGRALVDALQRKAARAGKVRLSLWCLESLPSVLFWRALGFQEVARRRRSRKHSREQIRFVQAVTQAQPLLFQVD